MDVSVRLAVPVGFTRWRDAPLCYSPIVKITYELKSSGWASIAADQEPLSNGRKTDVGFEEPSDFAEAKGACELAIVGRALRENVGPLAVRVGDATLRLDRARDGGAVARGGGRTFFARDAARMNYPTLPLEIAIEGMGEAVRCAIPTPAPDIAFVAGRAFSEAQRVRPFVDAVLIDPAARRATLVYRGFFSFPGDVDREGLLVVDALGKLDVTSPRELARWPKITAATLADFEEPMEEATQAADEDDEDDRPTPVPPEVDDGEETGERERSPEPVAADAMAFEATSKLDRQAIATVAATVSSAAASASKNITPQKTAAMATVDPAPAMPARVAEDDVVEIDPHEAEELGDDDDASSPPAPLAEAPAAVDPRVFDRTMAIVENELRPVGLPFHRTPARTIRVAPTKPAADLRSKPTAELRSNPPIPPPPPTPKTDSPSIPPATPSFPVFGPRPDQAAIAESKSSAASRAPARTVPMTALDRPLPTEEVARNSALPFQSARPQRDKPVRDENESTQLFVLPTASASQPSASPSAKPSVATAPAVSAPTFGAPPPRRDERRPTGDVAPASMVSTPSTEPPPAPTEPPPTQAQPLHDESQMQQSLGNHRTEPPPPPSMSMRGNELPAVEQKTEPPPPMPAPRRKLFDVEEHTAQIQIPVASRAALPFVEGARGAVTAASVERAPAEEDDDDRQVQTLFPPARSDAAANLVTIPRAAPAPPRLAELVAALGRGGEPDLAPTVGLGADHVGERTALPVARAASASSREGAVDKRVSTITVEEYATLRAELWRAGSSRRELLRARGLSELRWRAIERRFAREIDSLAKEPDRLLPLLTRLDMAVAKAS